MTAKTEWYVLDNGDVIGPMTMQDAEQYRDYGSPNYGRGLTRTIVGAGVLSPQQLQRATQKSHATGREPRVSHRFD